jgi:hypothetical protein
MAAPISKEPDTISLAGPKSVLVKASEIQEIKRRRDAAAAVRVPRAKATKKVPVAKAPPGPIEQLAVHQGPVAPWQQRYEALYYIELSRLVESVAQINRITIDNLNQLELRTCEILAGLIRDRQICLDSSRAAEEPSEAFDWAQKALTFTKQIEVTFKRLQTLKTGPKIAVYTGPNNNSTPVIEAPRMPPPPEPPPKKEEKSNGHKDP